MGDRFEIAIATDIDVGEEAGGEVLLRLDQSHLHCACGILVDVARDRPAAGSPADNDQRRLRLTEHGRRKQRSTNCAERGAGEHREITSCQISHVVSSLSRY